MVGVDGHAGPACRVVLVAFESVGVERKDAFDATLPIEVRGHVVIPCSIVLSGLW